MKDKFEEAIKEQTYILPVGGKHKIKGISHAAERCNTLHQQALKEAEENLITARRNIFEKLEGIARELHFAGYTNLEGQLKEIAEEL